MKAWGRGLRSQGWEREAAGRALGLALLAGVGCSSLVACGADEGTPPGGDAPADVAPAHATPGNDLDPANGAPQPFGRYQFVETDEGMTIEAQGANSVQTFSCPVRSCPGLCDECAAAACRAAGELESACAALVATCSDACNCGPGSMGCGFPVYAFDSRICYIGDGQLTAPAPESPQDGPQGPAPDPQPEAARPESGSNNASLPSPVP